MVSPRLDALIATVFATAVLQTADPTWSLVPANVTLDQARELHRAGSFEAAAETYRAVLEDVALDESAKAIASNNLCVVLDSLGDFSSAESACLTALELRRGLGDPRRLARTLNNLGLVVQHLGRYREAGQRFTEALSINRNLDEPLAQAINLSNLGAVATQAGRFQEALERQREVSDLAREHTGEPWAGEQLRISQLNRGVVLERLGAYREALEVYRALLEESPGLRKEEEASILVNSGVIYRNLGDPVHAIERFKAAAAVYSELGDRSGLAHTELNIGIALHLNLKDAAGAEASYGRALEVVELSGDRGLGIDVRGFLGRLLLSTGRVDEARRRFEESLVLARESGSAEGVWVSLAGLGEAERSRGDLGAALAYFERAIALIEEGRAEVARPEHRASFLADKRAVYSAALETLAGLDDGENGVFAVRALEVAQRAKSRDLLDALELRQSSRMPGAASLKPLGGEEIAHRLGDHVLVEYFVTGTDLLMWWTEAGSIRLARLGDPRPILEAVGEVHQALSNGSEPAAELVDGLSETLLGPLRESSSPLGSRALPETIADVWIAPDRRLRYLPFEILSVPEQATGGSDHARVLLLERARISYLPSAWALPVTDGAGRPGKFEVGFLGFGGVDSTVKSEHAPWRSRLSLEPLPATRREVESIARRLDGPTKIFFGVDATEASFRANAGRTVGVMHFATHTALSEGRGAETAILLTPERGDDGLLTPDEIVETVAGSALVVLASCTTALGAEHDGRALTTLTGAFLAAGARAVLATLWPVGDQPTAVFMDQFYYLLSKGRTPAEALRETKMRFMKDDRWRSPALWSGYVLIGSSTAVVQPRVPWKALGVLALALALALAALGWKVRASL